MLGQQLGELRGRLRLGSHVTGVRDAFAYRRAFGPSLQRRVSGERRSEFAVVVHLYHLDLWPTIEQRIRLLPPTTGVFVTTPKRLIGRARGVVSPIPQAMCVPVPNRGRDVLPFLAMSRVLSAGGYAIVLKLHTKRSAYHQDADAWFTGLLDDVLPEREEQLASLSAVLADPRTGVVGPARAYFAGSTHLASNVKSLRSCLGRALGSRGSSELPLERLAEVGFFGGTIFWARLDAIAPLLRLGPRAFEREHGQIDGTAAHAVERLLTMLPDLQHRDIYTSGPEGLTRASSSDTVAPPWPGVEPAR